MTITEFLLARIAEDEQDAEDWIDPPGWTGWQADEHMAKRVRAEARAKRAIVGEHRGELGYLVFYRESDRLIAEAADQENVPLQAHAQMIPACLRHLAAVYADHPDYRPEWRP